MSKNIPASVHQRLLNRAREVGRPFNELLQYYAMERFLYRLSRSDEADSFILKGALLFRVWDVPDSRATRDMDFLAFVDNSVDELVRIVKGVLELSVPDDGLVFDVDSVTAERITEGADYEGVRVVFRAYLGKATIRMQADVGFGDVIHPKEIDREYPVLLDYPAPRLRTYPPETVVAEKLQAMVHLGAINSRMKDFYDIWRLSRQQGFSGNSLREAIRRTLDNRATKAIPFSDLAEEILESDTAQQQWTAFVRKSGVEAPKLLEEVLDTLDAFLGPILGSLISDTAFEQEWRPAGPWAAR